MTTTPRDLAAALNRQAVRSAGAQPAVRGGDWRLATVDTVGSDGTVTTTDGIVARRFGTYLDPAPGDLIKVSVSGAGSWLAMGRLGAADSGSTWTAYTSSFTAAGGGAALGNGVLDTEYTLRGDECHVRISFVAGSSTTFGTGALRWGLPFTAAALPNALMFWPGAAMCVDATVAYYPGVSRVLGSTNYIVGITGTASGGTANEWRGITPFTWGNGDGASLEVTYRVA
ncbi:hypothetical protein ACFVZH_02820 [Streptomyces sp. NPDC059534]|uniref:hypothetical protein n=1 Tax=Streptomyces sp. NPDC059534 TaxID=3346859 RepID=UPI00367A222C